MKIDDINEFYLYGTVHCCGHSHAEMMHVYMSIHIEGYAMSKRVSAILQNVMKSSV